MEVWIQEHQVDRQDPLAGETAAYHLEHKLGGSLRLLLERQSEPPASTFQPGRRAAPWRGKHLEPEGYKDPDIQRLWQGRCGAVQRNGFDQELLIFKNYR